MNIDEVIELAKKCGFDEVGVLDTQTLNVMDMVRDTCKTNKCGAYETNWGCPPHGEKEEDEAYLKSFKNGIIIQCVGHTTKKIDTKMYMETGKRLADALRKLADEMKKEYPDALILGAGGCSYCKKCARPEPCRFPDKRIEALEGYGIFITRLCQDNNIKYYYGDGTIAYSGALLW